MDDTANETRDWSENYEAGTAKSLNINGLEYKFRYCPAGTFMMGSPKDEEGHGGDNVWDENWETQHKVTLTQGFWFLETEVTQAMWKSAMGKNPSWFSSDMGNALKTRCADKGKLDRDELAALAISALKASGMELLDELPEERLPFFAVLALSALEASDMDTSNFPVEMVSWEDCQEFVEKLNSGGYAPEGWKFRLPTEAEWEYACRAGTTTPFSWGTELNGDKANCDGAWPYGTSTRGERLFRTTKVGGYAPNAWGLYDMHGNVKEWCSDCYGFYCEWRSDSEEFVVSERTDPTGPSSGSHRVLRGGAWSCAAENCRSAYRNPDVPTARSYDAGVRIALGRER